MKFEVVNNFSKIPPLVEDLDSNPSWPILKISAFPGHRFSCKQTGDGGVDQALGTWFFLPASGHLRAARPQSPSCFVFSGPGETFKSGQDLLWQC